jgi:putative ABC transport system permease protein
MSILSKLVVLPSQVIPIIGIAFKRLVTQRFLSLAAIAGLMVASGFILSVPIYADATHFQLLREELLTGRETEMAQKPADYAPFSFVFELKAVGRNSPQWKNVVEVDNYLSKQAPREIGLPILQVVRRFHTDGYLVFPPRDPDNPGTQYSIGAANLTLLTPLEKTITLVQGSYPAPFESLLNQDYLQVLASEEMASKIGLQIGDTYYLRHNNAQIPVTIVGLWRPTDPKAPYWDASTPQWMLVNEVSYTGAISDVVTDELWYSTWYLTASGANLHAGDVAGLDQRIKAIANRAGTLLPNTKLIASPLAALDRYQKNAQSLTYLLYAFSVPILALILAFIGLVAGLFVGQQRGEMAILRSRGASSLQVIGISLLQGALLGVVALAGGIGLGILIAYAIGKSRSFLDFSATGAMRISVTPAALGYGLLGIALLLLVQVLIPTLGAAENTIVSYKQERARSFRQPWWQRYWIDLLLLLPAGYGLWLMQQQIQKAADATAKIPDPLQNPLLLLVPALIIFAAALFTLRIIPRLMELLSWLLRPTDSVGLLMAARYLARTPAFYNAPLVLLVLTLGLSAFTASLARTLDSQLEKQMRYQSGADLNIYELGTASNETRAVPIYTFVPTADHLSLPGVRTATPVGRYKTTVLLAEGPAAEGAFLGIDRLTFAKTAYWNKDFATQSIGSLMNLLGANPEGVLVPTSFLKTRNLKIGDKLRMAVVVSPGQSQALEARIVGTFDLFPTWYPENGPMFVGNLDQLFLQAGGDYPHEVWMSLDPSADPEKIVYGVRGYSLVLDQEADQTKLVKNGLNTFIKDWSSAELNIRAQQRRPDRQGLFGLLSVGFVASALLTVLGFLLYALFSFRRRFIEMGMLRAVGLSVKQMQRLLAAELGFLVLTGIGMGTLLGVVASYQFVPLLQIGSSAQSQFPPFQIEIAWLSIIEIYILFGILFLVALGALSALLVRMKIFQAIKLGETS